MTGVAQVERLTRLLEQQQSPKYGALRKELEQKLALPPPDGEQVEKYVDSVRIRWEKLSEECPPVPQRIWDRVMAAVRASATSER
jgi:hypothetical protein